MTRLAVITVDGERQAINPDKVRGVVEQFNTGQSIIEWDDGTITQFPVDFHRLISLLTAEYSNLVFDRSA